MLWNDHSDNDRVVVYGEFKNIKVENINSNEICFLQMYKDMFGKNYNPQVDKEHLEKQHIAVQNITYLFQIHRFYIQDYTFLWDKLYDKLGPFNSTLERALKKLDEKPNDIAKFYEEIDDETIKRATFTNDGALIYPDLMEIIKSNRPEGCSLCSWLEAITIMDYFKNKVGYVEYKDTAEVVMRNRPDINKDILPRAWFTEEALRAYNYEAYHKTPILFTPNF